MVKSTDEIAAERAAQRRALREAMRAGRERVREQEKDGLQHSPKAQDHIQSKISSLPPIPGPLPPLPSTPSPSSASSPRYEIPAPPTIPLPPPPPSEPERERPASALSTASSTSVASLDFATWASSSANPTRTEKQRMDVGDASDSEESALDLDESIDEAAERSGIISDGEGDVDDPNTNSRFASRSNSSTLDLLAASQQASLTSTTTSPALGYSSSDEEDFDYSLDASSVGTSRQSRQGDSLSRLSVASFASSQTTSSALSTPRERDRFPSPKLPFSLKAGLLSPPGSAHSSVRSKGRLSTQASMLSLSDAHDNSWRFSSASASDENTGRPILPTSLKRKTSTPGVLVASRSTQSSSPTERKEPQTSRPARGIRTSTAPDPITTTSPTAAKHDRSQSVASAASSTSSLDLGLDRTTSPSSQFPMPPGSSLRPKTNPSSRTTSVSRLKPVSSVSSLSNRTPSPRNLSEFGALPSTRPNVSRTQSTSGISPRILRRPSSIALPSPPASRPESSLRSALPVPGSNANSSRGPRRSLLPKASASPVSR